MHPLVIGNHTLAWGEKTYIMGIINLTPDSFSGDGLLPTAEAPDDKKGWKTHAVDMARRFLDAGADVLDIGGESTRPGSQPVDAREELVRVLPVIRSISTVFPQVLISIDTCKAVVADEALHAGAHIVNDVWGFRADPDLAGVAAAYAAPVVLMHNRSKPASLETRDRLGAAYLGAQYQDLLTDVKRELLESVTIARSAGIPEAMKRCF